jgi:hypothetical protein
MGRHRIYENTAARMRAYRARLSLRLVTESPADATEIERLQAKVRDLETELSLRLVTKSPSASPAIVPQPPGQPTEWERKVGLVRAK